MGFLAELSQDLKSDLTKAPSLRSIAVLVAK